jgi:hypothetical protein
MSKFVISQPLGFSGRRVDQTAPMVETAFIEMIKSNPVRIQFFDVAQSNKHAAGAFELAAAQ